ncbi:hypothetical protein E8E13_003687 [Curvularia kusanoi]|uniref:Arb2 domain-containing protein n=1 Tax=Curvularia kusanoi TaxID=90978 RepID=A0A9P4W9L5_CURKU|nr:hypothetical protein E8E13_003687 [Curvularia kusanoi]
MSQFRAAKLDIGCFAKIRNIRDHTKRKVFAENEPERQALRYIIRNTTLPQRVRAQAQLQLSQMHCYTRFTQVKNRCIMGGKGRGVFSDFRLGRYQFRMNALAGNLPGVKKASWREADTLAPDAYYPADLKELGFFINTQGQIRMIEAPEKAFVFNATNNERHNEMRNEAFHTCSRAEVIERLSKVGIKQLYLPQLLSVKPNGPHIPILAPPMDVLRTRKRIIVIVNDSVQDLGILAYRQLQRELGINGGSVVNFAKEMINHSAIRDIKTRPGTVYSSFDDGVGVEDSEQIPGLIVLNTGQRLYSHKQNRSMTTRSWRALPRLSIAHDSIRIDEKENHVDGHRTPSEHIKSVFDNLLCNAEYVNPNTEIYVIAIEGGANDLVDVLKEDFNKYGTRIDAMALVHTSLDNSEITQPNLKAFMHRRTRQWKFTDERRNPTQCTELPDDYSGKLPEESQDLLAHAQETELINWDEELRAGTLPELTSVLRRMALDDETDHSDSSGAPVTATDPGWGSGAVPCPTFAGGKESTGECIFAQPIVQQAILSFFKEVAQDPVNYRNPEFTTSLSVPQPTVDAPLVLDASVQPETANVQPTSPLVTPEQSELDEAHTKLKNMRDALVHCPENIELLAKGRAKLVEKIASQEVMIKELQAKALGNGSLRAGEAEAVRQDWSPKVDGQKVSFAGTMVDSELLKAAGLGETAIQKSKKRDEEMEQLNGEIEKLEEEVENMENFDEEMEKLEEEEKLREEMEEKFAEEKKLTDEEKVFL